MNDKDSNGRRGRSRRAFLAAAGGGVATATALGGCLELGEEDEPSDPDEDDGDSGDGGDDGGDGGDGGDGDDGVLDPGTPTDTPMTTTAATTMETATTSEPTERTTKEPTATATATTTTTTAPTDPDASNRVLRLDSSTISTLDPIAATDTSSGRVIHQLFDSLLTHPDGEARVEGKLTTDLSVSSDYRTYTFELKEGVQFHDGSELTADDVVYSFERLAASENSNRTYFVLSYALNIEHETGSDGQYVPGSLAVEAVDDYTFKLRLATPFAPTLDMLAYSSFSVIPRGIVGDVDVMPAGTLNDGETTSVDGEMTQRRFAQQNPVGTGAFEFEYWAQNDELEVRRFDAHHDGPAAIGGVSWKLIPRPEAAYQYGQNLNSDFVSMPTSKYDPGKVNVEGTDDLGRRYGTYGPMANGRTANYLEVATINTFYVGFNCENVPKPVRQAFAYVMNQQEAVDQVFKGRGIGAYHLTPPNIYPGGAPAYDSHARNRYPYGYDETRLDAAKQVMEDAGYGPNNEYELTFTTYQSPTWQGIGKITRDKLASAHVDLALEEAPFSTLLNRGRSGDLEAYSLGWIMDWPAPDNFLGQVVPEKTDTDQSGGPSGYYLDWDTDGSGGSSAIQQATEAWEVIEDNREPTTAAKEARNEAYVAMEEALWQDMALLPVYHSTSERFWYDWVDVPRFGGLGSWRQTFDDVTIEERNR